MKTFKQFLFENEGGADTVAGVIAQEFIQSEIGKQSEKLDCKSVTRNFVKWAKEKGIPTKVIHLAPPHQDVIKNNPQFGGKSGNGDSHIMPIVDGHAIDFTFRQFDQSKPFSEPVITPLKSFKSVYKKYGYFTNKPDHFNHKTHEIKKPHEMKTIGWDFPNEILYI